jgi:hypothetical protein
MELHRLGQAPVVWRGEGGLSPDEVARVLALLRDEDALARAMVNTQRDQHGSSWELPVGLDPLLGEVQARILAWLGMPSASLTHLRVRRYLVGQGHPPHCDNYEIAGERLCATVLIGLERADEGGQTEFPLAEPEALRVGLAPGELVAWFNLRPDGRLDPRSTHAGLPVEQGAKTILAAFLYAPVPFDSPRCPASADDARDDSGERLYCIVDQTPASTVEQLRDACEERGVEFVQIDAACFDFVDPPALEPGAMLYRPAISNAAVLAEQLLCHEQVATFYAHPWGAHLLWDQQTLLLARAGVPTPRTFHRVPRDRDQLRHIVAALGGFPVILKALGGSLGVGVMRLDSFPALFSVVDYALSRGSSLNLMACVEPATHWRVVVVGDSIAAAYRNQPDDDDFRTHVEDRPEDFLGEAPPEVLETAIRATQLLGLEFGGVDLLEHDSGRVYLLEVNFPCYFGHPKEIAGVDVAGVMLDHLRAKARALRAP